MSALKVSITIPNGYSYEQKQNIASRVLDYIKIRTLSGFDKNENAFVNYTLNYAKEKGVSTSSVDLQRTGDMLNAMRVLNILKNTIVIGFDGRTKQSLKAEGNILGTYGQARPTGKARDFLGINEESLNKILEEFPLDERGLMNQRIDNNVDSLTGKVSDQLLNKWKKEQLLQELGIQNPPSWLDEGQ